MAQTRPSPPTGSRGEQPELYSSSRHCPTVGTAWRREVRMSKVHVRKLIGIVGACFLVASALVIPGRASPPKAESVSYKSGEDTVTGYLALPDSPGPHPAIVVVHEWWGLNDWVKEQAQRFANQGYAALAVDLYRGKSASNPDEAHELMRGMPHDRALRDLKAAFDYLASRPGV